MARKRIAESVRRAVIVRDKGICQYCGDVGEFQVFSENGWVWQQHELDHVIPLFLGGENSEGNIVVACRRCNRSKGHKTLAQWGRGVLLNG